MCELEEGELIRTMPECEHIFHSACLEKWARTQGVATVCPMCRKNCFLDEGSEENSLAHLEANEVREELSEEEQRQLIARARPLADSLGVELVVAALTIQILENDLQSAAHVLLEHHSVLVRIARSGRARLRDTPTLPNLKTWSKAILASNESLTATRQDLASQGMLIQLQNIEFDDALLEKKWEELDDRQRTRIHSLVISDVIDRLNGDRPT